MTEDLTNMTDDQHDLTSMTVDLISKTEDLTHMTDDQNDR